MSIALFKPFLPIVLLAMSSSAVAQTTNTFDSKTWLNVATQTCIAQAPHNSSIQALRLSSAQLKYNCRCVAREMLTILPHKEKLDLLKSMQSQHNLQRTGERMMNNLEVKKAALACSAAAWWY